MFLSTLLFVFLRLWQTQIRDVAYEGQPGCFSVLGNTEVLLNRSMDVDQDGKLDNVIVYGGDDIYVLIVSNAASVECKVVLNERITSRRLITEDQKITIRELELVEMTGDNQPELHLWLEKRGGGPREEVSLHEIYTLQNGQWHEAAGFAQCLAFSSFEIRNAKDMAAKEIYVDEDRHCEPPFSTGRTYSILKWNGTRFLPDEYEHGSVPAPFSQTVYGVCAPYALGAILILMITFITFSIVRKRLG